MDKASSIGVLVKKGEQTSAWIIRKFNLNKNRWHRWRELMSEKLIKAALRNSLEVQYIR